MKRTVAILILFLIFLHKGISQNNSIDFDGIGGSIGIPHSNSLYIGSDPLTLEFWFKTSISQESVLMAKNLPYTPWNQVSFIMNDGSVPSLNPGEKIVFFCGEPFGNYRYVVTVNDIADGKWHHIAGIIDPFNQTITLYIDGSNIPVNSFSNGTFPSVTNHEQYRIGNANTNALFYVGKIDEVRIWNTVRTQTQIQNNMNTELSGTESGLVSYYKMDQDNSSCDIEDCNSNENHGTRYSTGGSSNLPQFSSDAPFLLDVACGATTSCIILPVELVEFKGKHSRHGIELLWRTANELANEGFEIQKSNNGRDWEKIGFVKGAGTATEIKEYKYQDINPFVGINYYRLKQVDFDEAFEYSNVIAIEYDNSVRNINIFPNPSNGIINLLIDNPLNQRMSICISDNLGRKIWKREWAEEESVWRKELEIEENGIYFVTAQIGNKISYERLIITAKN